MYISWFHASSCSIPCLLIRSYLKAISLILADLELRKERRLFAQAFTNWTSGVRLAFLKTDSNNFFLSFCIGNLNLYDYALLNFIWLDNLERTQEKKQNRLHRLSINRVSSQTKSLRLFWFCPIVLCNNGGIKRLVFFALQTLVTLSFEINTSFQQNIFTSIAG